MASHSGCGHADCGLVAVYFREHCATVAVVIACSEVLAATGTPLRYRFQVSAA